LQIKTQLTAKSFGWINQAESQDGCEAFIARCVTLSNQAAGQQERRAAASGRRSNIRKSFPGVCKSFSKARIPASGQRILEFQIGRLKNGPSFPTFRLSDHPATSRFASIAGLNILAG
jgi:hypothetical protein